MRFYRFLLTITTTIACCILIYEHSKSNRESSDLNNIQKSFNFNALKHSTKNITKEKGLKKRDQKFYQSLQYEQQISQRKLNSINTLVYNNKDQLPPRQSNLSAHDLCKNESNCVPPFKRFETEIRTAPKYKLSACVVQKSMSTVTTSMFCYLRDEKKFVENKREILRDWKIIRFCERKNEFLSMNNLIRKHKIKPSSNWTHIMIVRHPLERFVSGFVDKCYRKPVIHKYCNGCRQNLTCFMETELARMNNQLKESKFQKTYEDRHFFPQSWRCDLHNHYKNFTFVHYTSDPKNPIQNSLFEIFRKHNVPQESLDYLNNSLSSGRTAHSTVETKATKFIYKRLTSSPYLMELLVRMFYHDFVLFGFKLPSF